MSKWGMFLVREQEVLTTLLGTIGVSKGIRYAFPEDSVLEKTVIGTGFALRDMLAYTLVGIAVL